MSYREISRRTEVSCSTVTRIARNLQNGLPATANKRRNCRRPRKTTTREDRKIIRTVLKNRKTPIRALNTNLKEDGINISSMTLRRRLYEEDIKSHRPTKRPFLTGAMKKKRLLWARLLKDKSENFWHKVIFSDECRLEVMTESTNFVRRKPGEQYNADCLVYSVNHPPSVMIWGCIMAEGPGPLYFVEGTLRQDQYRTIILNVFLPYLDTIDPSRTVYTFMQDGAPCHTAKSINEVFQNEGILVLPWPGNSPDMNPIENCWARLKSIVYSRHNPTKAVLMENIRDVWENDEIFKQVVINNMSSMSNRIKEIIKAKGGCTKY